MNIILILKAIIIGIVEGITEFLPISSTGHMIIVDHFIGFENDVGKLFANNFEVIIQLGAILSVIYYYREKIFKSLINLKPGQWGFRLWLYMFIAFLPAAILGFKFNDDIKKFLFNPLTVSFALVFGAILILIAEGMIKNRKSEDITQTGWKKALVIGIAQCMALFPGMSRSSSTIIGGLLVGFTVKAAAEFSFFLAIPTMVAATGYSMYKDMGSMTGNEWILLAIGFVTSFIVALIVIDKFLGFLTKHSLKPFAYYRLVVGFIMIALIMMKII